MDILRELYDSCDNAEETETALMETNKKLVDYIESNVANEEKAVFLESIEEIMKCREQYFFQAGFNTAKELLMK